MDFRELRNALGLDRHAFLRRLSRHNRGPLIDEYILAKIERNQPVSADRLTAVRNAARKAFPEDVAALERPGVAGDPQPDRPPVRHAGPQSSPAPTPSGTAAAIGGRKAMLIGINDYSILEPLRFARCDAEAVAGSLSQHCGFGAADIDLITCASDAGENLLRAVSNRLIDLVDSSQLELLVFGFWGHGIRPAGDELYMCGANARYDNLERSAIPLSLITRQLRQVAALNTLIILDCCQANPFGQRGGINRMEAATEEDIREQARLARPPDDTERPAPSGATAILTACRPGEAAHECAALGNGYFTAGLLRALDDGHRNVVELAERVSEWVPGAVNAAVGHRQSPWLSLEGSGSFNL